MIPDEQMTGAIEITRVSHRYAGPKGQGERLVIRDVSLTIRERTFVSFLGPSGCGKTTLLRIASGLVKPTAGLVRIRDQEVTGPSPDRAVVFQEFNLLPWRTARQNVELPLQILDIEKRERGRIATNALIQVGLANFADYYPHQLSGGMKQRVGLARALAVRPSYLFMDEPFGALDPQIREMMQLELLKLWDQDRKTVVFVTHSVDEAIFLSDRVVVFSSQPGRIVADITIDLPRPRWELADAIKADARYVQYRQNIWLMLKSELEKTA